MAKILIVEDETELAEVLEYNLRKEGCEVLTAFDGLSACRSIGAERPDLILLDILLPDLDGWEVCRLLRRMGSSAAPNTPALWQRDFCWSVGSNRERSNSPATKFR